MGLVLTRREGEGFTIEGGIEVRIISIGRYGRQCQVWIDAPGKEVVRTEIRDRAALAAGESPKKWCRHKVVGKPMEEQRCVSCGLVFPASAGRFSRDPAPRGDE